MLGPLSTQLTLLLCDDNWGNLRKLPKPGDKPRKGGYGYGVSAA